MAFYDLIVIGSGVLGTFHAYHAARMGKRVLILEKDSRPLGATVRNFGQVVPSGLGGRWFDYGRRSLEIYASIQREWDLGIQPDGSVYVASDEDELRLIHELYDRRQNQDYACELLTASQTLARYPALRPEYVRGALFFPQEVSVESAYLMDRLLQYLQTKYAVTYLTGSPVIDCQSNYSGAVVTRADRQRFQARQVLICSGSEFRLLFPDVFVDSGLIVSKLQMMRTVPMPEISLPGNVLTGLTIRRYEAFSECPSYAGLQTPEALAELKKWGIHLLFKQAPDGSIIIGDSHEYAPALQADTLGYETKDYINHLILQEAARIVQFPLDRIARTWAGYYAQTEQEVFEYEIDPHIRILTGIGGKGMTSSAGYAEENVAKLREVLA